MIKSVVGFEGYYEISDDGEVWSLPRNGTISGKRRLKFNETHRYSRFKLNKDGQNKMKLVHRMVAEAFLPNPENKYTVNHIDGNPRNNNYKNLEWCTTQANTEHTIKAGLWKHVGNTKSGYIGVSIHIGKDHKPTGKFMARIHVHGKRKYLGIFDTKEEAAEAHDIEALRLGRHTNNMV
jgi:hypothetical protein